MPRVGIVAGLDVYVQDERTAKHKEIHCHVRGGGHEASINLRTLQVLRGSLPRNKRRDVMDWLRRHQGELLENFYLVRDNGAPNWIED